MEDEWGVFQLARTPEGHIRATCNRTELVFLLGAFATSYVQEMQGHIGSFLRPHSRVALVLGSGYGLTAGALAENPRLEKIDEESGQQRSCHRPNGVPQVESPCLRSGLVLNARQTGEPGGKQASERH